MPVARLPGSPHRFTTFDEGARSWAGVHGGVVVGAMLRAATETAGTSPVAVTAHLHSPVAPGLAQIGVLTQRAGRTVASLQAGLRQESVRARHR